MSPPASNGRLAQVFPILSWGRAYDREALIGDGIAAVVVTIMLIPQSLAYALLAGVPAEIGLYASMLPLVAYALFGSSRTLSVGPVAIVSLMTATALAQLNLQSTAEIVAAAAILALLSGVILLAMGVLRLGFVANFLSHPVISGFITASGILIAASQLKHLLGVPISGHTLPEILTALVAAIDQINLPTVMVGAFATAFLVWVRGGLARCVFTSRNAERAHWTTGESRSCVRGDCDHLGCLAVRSRQFGRQLGRRGAVRPAANVRS
jgi:SulP family sulfate permease